MSWLAWVLATSPVDKLRDGKRAVELAKQAVELTGGKQAEFHDTLAAAYAEAGQFDEAVRSQERALEDARYAAVEGGGARQRLELYRSKKPYHSK